MSALRPVNATFGYAHDYTIATTNSIYFANSNQTEHKISSLVFNAYFWLQFLFVSDFHLSKFNDLSLTRGIHICKIALIFDPIFLGLLGISCFFNDILKTLKITNLTNILNIMLLSTQTLAEF